MALLPKNQRDQAMVLVTVLALGVVGAYWNWVWQPKHSELAQLALRVDSLEARNAKARAQLAKGNVSELQVEAERHAQQLEVIRQLVPTANELPALLEEVSNAARRQGLDISAVEPQPVEEGELFDTYRYRLAVTGSYHALAAFLANVGSLSRIVTATNLTLTPVTNPNATVVKLLPPGAAALETKFEIQAFVLRNRPASQDAKRRPAGGKS
jgi:type IV pilus assembly protein PilO